MKFDENRPVVRLLWHEGRTDCTRSVGAYCASLRSACTLNYDEKDKGIGLGRSEFSHRVLCVTTDVSDEQCWWMGVCQGRCCMASKRLGCHQVETVNIAVQN